MTDLLRKVVAKVETLSPPQQDFYAQVLLEEMESDQRWDELFARPIEGTRLERLIQEAEADNRAGGTLSLDALLANAATAEEPATGDKSEAAEARRRPRT